MKRPLMADQEFQSWLKDHIFTPSELESFLLAPFRFYAAAFLKLEPEVEWEVEMTPAETGRIIHRTLERYFKEKSEILGLLEEEIASFQKNRPHLSTVLLERQKTRIGRTLLAFLEQEVSESTQKRTLVPRFFEWSFEMDSPTRIRGRIDRIDVDEKTKRFLVIHYKTGSRKITGSQIRSGESLQLPLYLLAVQRLLLPDYEPIGAIYYHLSDMTKKDGILHAERLPDFLEIHPRSSSLIPAAQWETLLTTTEHKVSEIVSEIQKGLFEPCEETCEPYCPYQDICRIRSGHR